MKQLLLLWVGVFLLGQFPARSETVTNGVVAELTSLVGQINSKLQAGKDREADLTNELSQFDALLARHAGEQSDAVAAVLVMKATLCAQVLNNAEQAQAALKRLNHDFPNSKYRLSAEAQLVQLEPIVAIQKIQETLVVGNPFPDFNETDLHGQPLSLARFKGKVVLVDFWATWCVPCRLYLPKVIAAYQKFHDRGFEVVGVSFDTQRAKLDAFLEQQAGMAWPQYFDEALAKVAETSTDENLPFKNKLGAKYAVQQLPSTFLVDGEGKIIAKDVPAEDLADVVSAALAKNK